MSGEQLKEIKSECRGPTLERSCGPLPSHQHRGEDLECFLPEMVP